MSLIRYIMLIFLIPNLAQGFSEEFKNLKEGIYKNYIRVGFYSDLNNRYMSDSEFEEHLSDFKKIGFSGVMFEITISVDETGQLLEQLEYERLWDWIALTKKNSLSVAILPTYTFNNEVATYVDQNTINNLEEIGSFSTDNFINAIYQYWEQNISRYEGLSVDLINIGLFTDSDFTYQSLFTDERMANWEEIFGLVRIKFSGAVTITLHKMDKFNDNKLSQLKIWELSDAISIWGKLFISDTPIYDLDRIQQLLWESPRNPTGFITEYREAASAYQKPIMLINNAFAIDSGLDGGWDPTEEQLLDPVDHINYEILNLQFESVIHHFNNHLSDYITSWTFGSWEPWSFGPSRRHAGWKLFDLANFPGRTRQIFMDLFEDGEFIATNRITASSLADYIIVPSDSDISWEIDTGGGADIIRLGRGDDQIHIPSITGLKIDFRFRYWLNEDEDTYFLKIYLDESLIYSSKNIVSSENCSGPKLSPCWAEGDFTSFITDIDSANSLKIEISNGFISVDSLTLSDGTQNLNLRIEDSVRPPLPKWAEESYITRYAIYPISEFQLASKLTIDAGDGYDRVIAPIGYARRKEAIEISNVEEIIFTDGTFAFGPLSTKVSNLTGILFGSEFSTNVEIATEVYSYLRSGYELSSIIQFGLEYKLGKEFSNSDLVNLIFRNVLGRLATKEELTSYKNYFDTDMVSRINFVSSLLDNKIVINSLGTAEVSDLGLRIRSGN